MPEPLEPTRKANERQRAPSSALHGVSLNPGDRVGRYEIVRKKESRVRATRGRSEVYEYGFAVTAIFARRREASRTGDFRKNKRGVRRGASVRGSGPLQGAERSGGNAVPRVKAVQAGRSPFRIGER